jgi:hypothetical protein
VTSSKDAAESTPLQTASVASTRAARLGRQGQRRHRERCAGGGHAKDVCECKEAQCINKAGEKYKEATDKMYADKQIRTPTTEQKQKMDDASKRVSECTDKLLKRK